MRIIDIKRECNVSSYIVITDIARNIESLMNDTPVIFLPLF